MGEACENHVFELPRLSRDGFRDQRVRVAVKVDPPRRYPVQQALARARKQVGAFAALNLQGRRLDGFLRVGMPDFHTNARESKCFSKTELNARGLMLSSQ